MNGSTLIREAYEMGRTHVEVYRPYDRYFYLLRRFIDSDYFGTVGTNVDGHRVPMHVNSARNPRPWRDRHGRPCRRTFGKRDLFLHLTAEAHDADPQFRFLVNSPKTRFHLLAIDVDANEDRLGHELTCEVYQDLFCAETDYGGHVYIERSRNRVGRYLWFLVERSSQPAQFNLLVTPTGHDSPCAAGNPRSREIPRLSRPVGDFRP
jgi:hypothetical protein